MQQSAPALGLAPDRAIRGRLPALLIDGILIALITPLVTGAVGIKNFGGILLAGAGVQFLYFFLQEAAGGRTIGKRVGGVHVVRLDGGPVDLQQVAVRNALRFFDALPLFYASGLLSVMWSGPNLRQRLGDRVAGTTVIVAPGGTARPTPGWLLPSLTVVSVLVSTIVYGAIYRESRAPNVGENSLAAAPVAGFAGDNSQPPAEGTYSARAMIGGRPVVELPANKPLVRSWQIAKRCAGSTCSYEITRTVDGASNETGTLAPAADGWHVTFPTKGFRATCPGSSHVTTVRRRAAFVMHFDAGGRTAEAHESNAFQSDDCGAFARQMDWNASLPTF
ncbi:MAG TPA: RDD family protein [Thermoleophilaceae bacterium]|nr:RDD family protein [Thermoleophilaceae bacterium]